MGQPGQVDAVTHQVLVGDCRERLREMPAASAHTCVTSPPYWCLRDYGVDGQLGIEETPEAFLHAMVEVFREVRRVLRPDGTLWLNMGDTYAAGGNGGGGSFMQERGDASWKGKSKLNGWSGPPAGFQRKDMIGMPWRLAFALQADGWVLRSEIIWAKPNCMPEAVEDRPTKSHEHLFLLAPSPTYFYDADAIREPVTGGAHTRGGGVGGKAQPPGKTPHDRVRQNESFGRAVRELVTHRNKRTVWTIPTQPYRGGHYATFPEDLARPCILAGTSEAGCCAACGAPRRRRVVIEGLSFNERTAGREPSEYSKASLGNPHSFAVKGSHGHVSRVRRTAGWDPTCSCDAGEPVPCTVLDPFTGSGTTGAVAVHHDRDFVGIEISKTYAELARARIAKALERAGKAGPGEDGGDGPVQLGLLVR